MNASDPIRQYIVQLGDRLTAMDYSSRRILSEVEDHLRQRADQLRATGMHPQEADLEAVIRFGATDEIVSQFDQQSPLPSEEEIMIRYSLTVLAAFTSLYAALHVVFGLVNEPGLMFTYVKVMLAVIVMSFGVIVVRWQWSARKLTEMERFAIFVLGLALIEIGAANAVWTAHLGLVSGDWEYYGFVGGMLISLLGALATIWMAFPDLFEANHDSKLTHAAG